LIDWQPFRAAFLFVDQAEVRPLEKFYFQDTETKKYYIVGAYDLDHAHELLANINEQMRSRLVAVAKENIPET